MRRVDTLATAIGRGLLAGFAGTAAMTVSSTLAPSRSSRWSPTRRALAIAVSAGLTADDEGKKLVSTT